MSGFRKWINGFTLAILFTLISFFVYRADFTFFRMLELKCYDLLVLARGERPVSGQVVIVAVDEKSLQEEGRWPWPRTLLANLVDRLTEAEVATIGFDILFPEKDSYVPFKTVEGAIKEKDMSQLNQENLIQWLQEASDSDRKFAEAIERSARTVLGYFVFSSEGETGQKAAELDETQRMILDFSQYSVVQRFDDLSNPVSFRSMTGMGISISELVNVANSIGYTSFLPDEDGILRWVPMVQEFEKNLYPPLSLQLLQQATGQPLSVRVEPYGIAGVRVGDIFVPTTESGDFLVNYYGPGYTFPHISATDILSGKAGAAELQGKIVIVGATAAGAHDLHNSPFGPLYPGVEVHANIIENILNQDYLVRPDWLVLLDLGMIFGSGLMLGIVAYFFRALPTTLFMLVGVLGYLATDYYIFTKVGIYINTVHPVFTIVFVYGGTTLVRFILEERQKRFIQKAFAKYLSPVMVEELVKNPDLLKSGGDERVMTITFSDMVGFTSISESMTYPQLAKHMNEYFTEMTALVLEEEGTVNQYAGDLIMASYGAPVPAEDHADRGVRVALRMQRRLDELNVIWGKRGLPPLGVRTGINSDAMFFGNLGSQQVYYYSVIGDSVNTAARLESANKQYGTKIMISEFTLARLKPDTYRIRILDKVKVKGKTKAVSIYDVYGDYEHKVDPALVKYCELYDEGFNLYLARDFTKAKSKFEESLVVKPKDLAAERMLERVSSLKAAVLPDDWDGTFVMTSK